MKAISAAVGHAGILPHCRPVAQRSETRRQQGLHRKV